VGNWFADPKPFPNGLKPIAEECHQLGMKFVVWFEPERVAPGTALAREHPEFVLGGEKGGLFKLNEEAARRYLTDLLSQRISEYGIDIYRNDFNIDPLGFWRQNDAPDRQGLTEIRYVEGHYALWDELRARHPGLMIDNCASGGRRIDLETCMRSVPLWRSDTGCSPGHPDWNQVQTAGLAQYIPLFSACVWTPNTYQVRSAATAGLINQFDYLDPLFPKDLAVASVAEAKEDQKFWYGDFYLLASASVSPEQFVAYQFHRPDLDAGVVLAFRHTQCGFLGVIAGLSGVNPAQRYDVEFIDDNHDKTSRRLTGEELRGGLQLRIAKPGGSLLARYRRSTD
jgi:alpha-galactosidase